MGQTSMVIRAADDAWDASGRPALHDDGSLWAAPDPRTGDRPSSLWQAAADAARYTTFLDALFRADAPAARQSATVLLAQGADPRRLYRSVARWLLLRAIAPARGGRPPHGLWALTATLFLSEALPADERAALLAHAIGLAVAAWPAQLLEPRVRPWHRAGGAASPTPQALADGARAAALAGDAASAGGALAMLLAGSDVGTPPAAGTRRLAYAAVLDAAALAEARRGGWGHVLVGAQHAVEMAELLSPAETLLALRPALASVARVGAAGAARQVARGVSSLTAPQIRCAFRLNRRPGRPGEAFRWAAALRSGPIARTVEEAMVSGLEVPALLDAAVLAGAQILAAARPEPGATGRVGAHGRLAALAIHTLLALHTARRARDLAPPAHDALLVALSLLDRTVRRAPRLSGRPHAVTGAPTVRDLAHAAAMRPTPHTLALVEAILAEHDEVQPRDGEVASALLDATGAWLGVASRDP